jgi:hypothetical protein
MTDPDQRGPAVDPRHGPEPHANPGPACPHCGTGRTCPHCGGGPLAPIPLSTLGAALTGSTPPLLAGIGGTVLVCPSCARVVSTSTSTSP